MMKERSPTQAGQDSGKVRCLLDTNVWISRLLLADSVAARAVDKAFGGI